MTEPTERAAEVDCSICSPECLTCQEYIATGDPDLRPPTIDEYNAAFQRPEADR